DLDQSPNTMTINVAAVVSIATVTDGAEPGTAGKFRVTLTKGSSTDTVISYTVGGTATPGAGNDYTALSGSVTIGAGQMTADIDVVVLDDNVVEPTETVIVTLTALTSGDPLITIDAANKAATVNITDDDTATASVAKVSDGTEPGTAGKFRVTLTKA